MSPENVILAAYEYFSTDTLDEDSLIDIALAANCPSALVAIKVLENMVESKMLEKQNRAEKIFYKIRTNLGGKLN